MPLYKYRAALEDGSKKTGYLESSSPQKLYQVLSAQNEHLISYQSVGKEAVGEQAGNSLSSVKKWWLSFFYKIMLPSPNQRLDYLIFLCQKLVQLTRSSFPLVQIFHILALSERKGFWQNLLFEMRARLLQGQKLSYILTLYPKIFDPLWGQLAQAGEKAGAYDFVFEELMEYLKWKKELDHDLKKALIYPCLLLAIMIIMILASANYLIPEIKALFQSFGQKELPLSTRLLVSFSEFLQDYGTILLLGSSVLICIFYGLSKIFYKVRLNWNKFIISLPWLGQLKREMEVLKFLDTLGFLLKSGIHLIDALESATQDVSNDYIAHHLQKINRMIQEGKSLSEACTATGFFSPFWISLIELGEQTGKLGELLQKNTYPEKKMLLRKINHSIRLLHPLLITIGGLMLMWIVFGTVLPIYDHMEEFLY